jgi:hypothetical protein
MKAPLMVPSARERAEDVVRELHYDPEVWATHGCPSEHKAELITRGIEFAVNCAGRDSYAAGFAAALAMLREPSEELSETLAELFDEHYLPAWRACREKYGRDTAHPAFASWGPKFLAAVADAMGADTKKPVQDRPEPAE